MRSERALSGTENERRERRERRDVGKEARAIRKANNRQSATRSEGTTIVIQSSKPDHFVPINAIPINVSQVIVKYQLCLSKCSAGWHVPFAHKPEGSRFAWTPSITFGAPLGTHFCATHVLRARDSHFRPAVADTALYQDQDRSFSTPGQIARHTLLNDAQYALAARAI